MAKPIVYIIGAGGFGIHHLEGIVQANTPLSITVIDSSEQTLARARAITAPKKHSLTYASEIPSGEHVNVAIIATTSASRAAATRTLLERAKKINYLILEKILFDTKADYASIERLLASRRVRA